MYGGGGVDDVDGVRGGGVGNDCVERADPALDSASNSYSEEEISVCDNGPSSSPAYTITDYLSTDYCLRGSVNDFDLRRLFYSKQEF